MMTEVQAGLRPGCLHSHLLSLSLLTAMVFCADSALAQIQPPKHCETPDRTEISFKLENGDRMVVALQRFKDPKKCLGWCVTGGATYHSKEGRIVHAIVAEGEFRLPGFWLLLRWQTDVLLGGSDSVVKGLGDAGSWHGIAYSRPGDNINWTAETTPGCARWPDGPNPITQPPVSERLTPGRAGSVEAIAPGPRITADRDRTVALFDSWVPNPQLPPDALIPVNPNGAARALRGDPIPSPGVSPGALMPLGSSSVSRTGIGGGGADGSASSGGFYGSYSPGGGAVRPPVSSSGIYGVYAPMSSSGASMSYTPKDNVQPVPSGSAVARPPMSSSGASMSYTPKNGPQPSGSAVPKQTSLSKTDQVQPSTTIRKIRPIHRSGSAAVIRKNMPAVRQLGPANMTVLRNSNRGAAGAFRGTQLRSGDPR